MAQTIHDVGARLDFRWSPTLDLGLVSAFARCISEGNSIHKRKHRAGQLMYMNLTVPEAMRVAKPRSEILVEWFYAQSNLSGHFGDLTNSLSDQLYAALRRWIAPFRVFPKPSSNDLFMILIADARSVLLVFQPDQGKVN
jgi:hypothetical protein